MPSLADDSEISKNLKRFASQRPDLYEGGPNREAEDENQDHKKPVVVWDGQSNMLTRTHANVAMMQAQQRENQQAAEKAKQDKLKR